MLLLTESTLYYRDLVLALYSEPATFDNLGPRIKQWSASIPRSATDTSSATSRSRSIAAASSRKSALSAKSSVTSVLSTPAHKPTSSKSAEAAPINYERPPGLRDEEDEDRVRREGESLWAHPMPGLSVRRTDSGTAVDLAPPYTQPQQRSPDQSFTQDLNKPSLKRRHSVANPDDEDTEDDETVQPYEPAEPEPKVAQLEASDLDSQSQAEGADSQGSHHDDELQDEVEAVNNNAQDNAEDMDSNNGNNDLNSAFLAIEDNSNNGGDEDMAEDERADGDEESIEELVLFGAQHRAVRTTASTSAKPSQPVAYRHGAKRPKTDHPPATHAVKSSGKPKMSDTPLECQQSKAFAKNFMPALVLWLGCSEKPWGPDDSAIEEACAAIYRVIYNRDFSDLASSEQTAILSISCERLCLWRNNFGSTAVAALLVLLAARGLFSDEGRIEFAKRLLVQTAFLYQKVERGKPINIFEGAYFVMVLSSHYQAIRGHVSVPEHEELVNPDYFPFAAFGLAAAACIRAIKAVINGQISNVDKTLTSILEAGCSPESGWAGVIKAKRIIGQVNRKPKGPKKGKGKSKTPAPDASAEPVTASAPTFSDANSGQITLDFAATARRCDDWRLRNACNAAISNLAEEESDEESEDDTNDKNQRSEFAFIPIQ